MSRAIAAALITASLIASTPTLAAADAGYTYDFNRAESLEHHPQWSLRVTDARDAWRVSRGRGVNVAVVDSGVGPTWELDGKVAASVNLGGKLTKRVDQFDHGTAVACLIAGRSGPRGITGMAPAAKITSVRIFDEYDAPMLRAVRGIRSAVNHGADVLNISWTERDTPALRAAIRYALRRNVIVVAGAGNDRKAGSPPQYPAAYPGVIAVGAVGRGLGLTAISNEGSYVDVVAPGKRVLSCDPFGTLSYYEGTSFSSPIVAGVVALMKAANPGLTPRRAERILRATARDLGAPGRDRLYGSGLVNAERAVRAARKAH